MFSILTFVSVVTTLTTVSIENIYKQFYAATHDAICCDSQAVSCKKVCLNDEISYMQRIYCI